MRWNRAPVKRKVPKTFATVACAVPFSFKCELGECPACPTVRALTLTDLGIPEDKEMLYATWEKGDLVKKEPTPSAFLEHLQRCLKKWISHNYIRRIQGEAISREKKSVQKASVLLHLDFAENWTVKLPDEIQSHHWSKSEVTIFTCVATTQKGAHNFAVVSDDMCHDSPHACYAVAKCPKQKKEIKILNQMSKTSMSHKDAAALVKNRRRRSLRRRGQAVGANESSLAPIPQVQQKVVQSASIDLSEPLLQASLTSPDSNIWPCLLQRRRALDCQREQGQCTEKSPLDSVIKAMLHQIIDALQLLLTGLNTPVALTAAKIMQAIDSLLATL